MPITNTTPDLTKREQAAKSGRYRSPRFEEVVTIALEDAGIAIPYKEFEQALHAAMGSTGHIPWLHYNKRNMYEKERSVTGLGDGFENAALTVAGTAIAFMAERGVTDNSDRRATMACMLDAFSQWAEPLRRQWDSRSEWDGETVYLGEPIYFSALVDGQGGEHQAEDAILDDTLIRHGARPVPEHIEFDGEWEDERLRAMWDVATPQERQVMLDVAHGTAMRVAAENAGYSNTVGRDKLKVQLPKRAGLPGYEGRALKTHCINGHPMSGDNLLITGGRRVCRTCARERQVRYRERQKT